MAVPLIGLQSQKIVQNGASASFNWLIQSQISRNRSESILADIREILPEELAHGLLNAIPENRKHLTMKAAIAALVETGAERVLPGNPMSVEGVLKIPGLQSLKAFDPFKPPSIELDTFTFHSESCFVGELHGDGYKLPVYFDEASRAQVAYCHENPVELTGILRWCPPYSPRGASYLQLALRVAAVWLA
jgi:hypothetical protein